MELKERYNFKGVLEDGAKREAWLELFDAKNRKVKDLYIGEAQASEQLRLHVSYAQTIEIPEAERRTIMVANLKAYLGAFKYWHPDDPLIDIAKAVTKRIENWETELKKA